MRRLLVPVLLLLLTASAARASGGAIVMIPLYLAGELIGLIAAPFQCHPDVERIDLEPVSLRVDDGPEVAASSGGAQYYVAGHGGDHLIVALAEVVKDAALAPRSQALVVPVLP